MTQQLKEAAGGAGFLYISNYGVDVATMDDFVNTVQSTITSMQESERISSLAVKDSMAGYSRLGGESVGKLLHTSTLDDMCWKYTWLENGAPVSPDEGFKAKPTTTE